MIRKILGTLVLFLVAISTSAQMPQLNPLPLNPKLKSGVLPNGLSYYIMHNEEPRQRANFYIAQKVGSTLEEESQLGLAHFLEHMAFNGLRHYPGKTMLNYLQSKGVRFGADINAYTDFDETVYNINNVPSDDKPLMDSVLLVLHDWSCGILLEEAEIDAERGVIQEEWRSRNNANFRMLTNILPKIYEEYQYEQTPIGKMEVVMNFKPETLREYYKKWYRPDQQGIVIVGDFDAEEMEKKVIDLFSTIPMPSNAAERVYPHVSDNEKPIYATFTDPELQIANTTISFKSEKVPFEMRNTQEIYIQSILKNIISSLINNRLQEHTLEADCQYAASGVYFGNFYVSKTKEAFNVAVVPKNDMQTAVADAMAVVARACKTGFTDSELERVRAELLSSYEKSYNEREKTTNDAFGNEFCRLFIDNEPAPGIEKEYEIVKTILPSLPVQYINQLIPGLLTENNMVIVSTAPENGEVKILSEDVMITTIKNAMNAEYEAFVDEAITEPLIANLPNKGKIVKTTVNDALGTHEFILSNGVKVVVKPTDFKADQVLFNAFRKGGYQTYSKEMADNVLMMPFVFETAKVGPFDQKTLSRYLAGKNLSFTFNNGVFTDNLSGSSTVKDLATLMEIIYTSFTNLSEDQATYDVTKQQLITQYQNADKNPSFIFNKRVSETQYPGNPFMGNLDVKVVSNADYSKSFELLKGALANAADYQFVFVGNIDLETFKPLLEQYIATLPASKPTKEKIVTPLVTARGIINESFELPMQNPGTQVYDLLSGNNVAYNLKNSVMMTLTSQLLQIVYTNTLREEEGGTYGAQTTASINPNTGLWSMIYVFKTSKEMQEKLINRAYSELENLLTNGTDEVEFNKVKSAMLKQCEIEERDNRYWLNGLTTLLRGHNILSGKKETVESVNLDAMNSFMKGLYDGKNRIQLVMEGVAAQ